MLFPEGSFCTTGNLSVENTGCPLTAPWPSGPWLSSRGDPQRATQRAPNITPPVSSSIPAPAAPGNLISITKALFAFPRTLFVGNFYCCYDHSVTKSCPILCDPKDRSTPGRPVHHRLPELTQTHVHRVRDAIQPSHPLSSPSPPALRLSHHQGLFQWVRSLHQVARGL